MLLRGEINIDRLIDQHRTISSELHIHIVVFDRIVRSNTDIS